MQSSRLLCIYTKQVAVVLIFMTDARVRNRNPSRGLWGNLVNRINHTL